MAWCGRDITFVRVGPALEHLDAKGPRLLCFGQLSPGYDTEVPESVKKKRFVCTPEAMGRPVLIPARPTRRLERGASASATTSCKSRSAPSTGPC